VDSVEVALRKVVYCDQVVAAVGALALGAKVPN
jgi:hypothetical protein